jgi:hypothetical protein
MKKITLVFQALEKYKPPPPRGGPNGEFYAK